MTRRLIIGISDTSGIVYGIRALRALRDSGIETHLMLSRSARLTLAYELPLQTADVEALADVTHRQRRSVAIRPHHLRRGRRKERDERQ